MVEEVDAAAGGFAEGGGEDDDCAEYGRGGDARALTFLLFLNGQGVKTAHSGALVEACPRARRGRGGIPATATRCVVDVAAAAAAAAADDDDDDVAIRPRIFCFKKTSAN